MDGGRAGAHWSTGVHWSAGVRAGARGEGEADGGTMERRVGGGQLLMEGKGEREGRPAEGGRYPRRRTEGIKVGESKEVKGRAESRHET